MLEEWCVTRSSAMRRLGTKVVEIDVESGWFEVRIDLGVGYSNDIMHASIPLAVVRHLIESSGDGAEVLPTPT